MSFDVALAATFQVAHTELSPARQAAVSETLLKLQRGHASVHIHALESLAYVGISVTKDAMRIVAQRDGDTLLLLYVDSHDAAYDWAKRHRTVQIGRIVRLLRVEEVVEGAPVAPPGVPGPLASLPDKVFRRFGIDAPVARWLRTVPDDDALIGLATLVSTALGQALIGLASDPDDEAALLQAFEAAKEVEQAPVPLAEAVRDPVNAAGIWVPPPGEEALAAALRADLATWRVFLHPSQHRLVRLRSKGPVKVTGGPGTGKTVVALHRARWLAEERFADDPRPVLLTAFSRPLVDALVPQIAGLCADRPELVARVEVRTTLQVAREVLKRAGRPHALLDGEVVDACWEEALRSAAGLDLPRSFWPAEREHVLVRQGAWTEAAYLQAKRTDRGQALDRVRRKGVWAVLAAFEAALARRGGGDAAALAREAAQAIGEGAKSPWSAVVCDEVQDAGPAELRLLAALTTDGGAPRPDGLFLCGDGHQRIFRAPFPLTACGIDVRGRAKRLRLNYRTTEGIRRAAVALVEGQPLDALDEGNGLDGYRSLRGGDPPVERVFASEDEETDWITSEAGAGLLVLARTNGYLDGLRKRIRERLKVRMLGDDEDLGRLEGIVLATLHRAKGLEAPRVVLAGMHLVPARWPGDAEGGDRETWERRERSLLYVGTTRARDWCGWSRVG